MFRGWIQFFFEGITGAWGFSTINGNRTRSTGILNNEMYVGRLVWNRQRFIKDPDTGKCQARPNPESEWVDPGGAGIANRRSGAVGRGQGATSQRQRQPRHILARSFPRETPSPLSVLRPEQMRLLWWRLFHDLRCIARLLDSTQQRHLRYTTCCIRNWTRSAKRRPM